MCGCPSDAETRDRPAAPSPLSRAPVPRLLLKAYKATLSPAFQLAGARCRHAPTCSEYAAEAWARHGFWAASWMALGRLSRCRPGGTGGHDPVPRALPEGARWRPWRLARWR